MDDLVSEFAIEAAEALAGLQGALAGMSLRRDDPQPVADMRRRLHGLKGLCGFAGLMRAEAVAHACENLLDGAARRGGGPGWGELAMLGEGVQRIAEIITMFAYDHVEPRGDDSGLVDMLEAAADGEPETTAGAPAPDAVGRLTGLTPEANERRGRAPWRGLDDLTRGLGDRLGKRIELSVGGDNLRISPAAAGPLRTALIALVRNACDHGVEPPADRRAAGKPAMSMLQLNLRATADEVRIDLIDDGRGIDPARLRRRACAEGELTSAEAEALSDAAVQDMIFTAGFSTAEVVTPISGRGLGLDVVRREAEALGGRIEFSSASGRGAAFTLVLPRSVLANPSARRLAAA